MIGQRGERGIGLVELVVAMGISGLIVMALGLTVVSILRNTTAAQDQLSATSQVRNGFLWLNRDTQSGVASLATVVSGDVTLQWTDFSTGTAYSSRYQQVGDQLVRTHNAGGSVTTQVVARNVAPGGFTASLSGLNVSYTLAVANGAGTQAQTETATMRVGDSPMTPFPTLTPSPTPTQTNTPTNTATATATPTPTNTPTPTDTSTATPTNTGTSTPTWTYTPTPTSTATNTPTNTATSTPTATATADVWLETGSYTGNGADDRTISGAGFQPDIVVVRYNNNRASIIRTANMPADRAKRIDANTALESNMIQSFVADGFVVGTDNRVNSSGDLYHWVAMKVGSNVQIGTYTGNGADNRNITGLPFQPDWVITMANNEQDVFRPALVAGDNSYLMNATDPVTNRIQAILADGFQVGSNNDVNRNTWTYYYIAFDATPKVVTASYTGNGADNRNITGIGITPAFVWVKRLSNNRSVWRSDTVTGDRSLYWGTNGASTNRIQALLATGFQVGTNNEVNNNNTQTYYYLGLSP